MGKKYIIANWKMNLNIHEASVLMGALDQSITAHRDVAVVLAPGTLALQSLSLQVDHRKFGLAAQNLYWRDEGAFTGEVSASQLRGLVQYALIGHSERRHIFGEQGREIGRKVQAAIRNHIRPVLCVGETALERRDGEMADVLHDQLVAGLANITSDEMAEVLIAYEPVWAIGTGENALPKDVVEASRVIRDQVQHMFGAAAARAVPVLYGGSVTADNAAAYVNSRGVDGLLVGGASLRVKEFSTIVERAHDKKS